MPYKHHTLASLEGLWLSASLTCPPKPKSVIVFPTTCFFPGLCCSTLRAQSICSMWWVIIVPLLAGDPLGLSKVYSTDRLSLDTSCPQANAEPDVPSGTYVIGLPCYVHLNCFSPPCPKVHALLPLSVPVVLYHVSCVGFVIQSCDYMWFSVTQSSLPNIMPSGSSRRSTNTLWWLKPEFSISAFCVGRPVT